MISKLSTAGHNIFSKENLTWKQIHFVKKHVQRANFVSWLKQNYDFLLCYHGCRPDDIGSSYKDGFLPSDFTRTISRFEQLLKSISYTQPYNIQQVLDSYDGQTNKYVYFILDKEDFIDFAPHYIIYGSELLLSLAQHVASYIKGYLKERGTPTIFHCHIPLADIMDCELVYLYDQIISSKGSLTDRRDQIFSNYTIIVANQISPACIASHEHPTVILKDVHTRGTYQNFVSSCSYCH